MGGSQGQAQQDALGVIPGASTTSSTTVRGAQGPRGADVFCVQLLVSPPLPAGHGPAQGGEQDTGTRKPRCKATLEPGRSSPGLSHTLQ